MHKYGVCHRDIKPENILIEIQEENGEPTLKNFVLIDLGVSKKFFVIRPGTLEPKIMEMWTSTGTCYYCAPEIFYGGGYNRKIDIWAVGVMFY